MSLCYTNALGGNKRYKSAIFSINVTIKVTRSFTLVSFLIFFKLVCMSDMKSVFDTGLMSKLQATSYGAIVQPIPGTKIVQQNKVNICTSNL